MRRLLVLAALAAALPGAAAAQSGSSLYAENCLVCHGPGGSGTSKGPRLRGVGALAADLYLRTGYMPLSRPGDQPARRHSPFDARQIEALVA